MESRTIALLKEAGKRGLLLSELVRELKQNASDIQKIVELLKRQGHIREVEEHHNGESQIRLFWLGKGSSDWDDLHGCPCFVCKEIEQCGAGQPTTPWYCVKLNKWITERINKT